MIVVRIFRAQDGPDEEQLAEIWIRKTSGNQEHGNYSVKYAVERGMAVGVHQRGIDEFPRKRYNVLALLLQALNTLSPKELELEDDFDPDEAPVSTDLARRFRGALRSLQGGER